MAPSASQWRGCALFPKLARANAQLVGAFGRWFGSPAGVSETLGVVICLVVAEYVWPHLDPQMFVLLVWLTIYSAVTQPALAAASTAATEQAERNAGHMIELQATLDAHVNAMAAKLDELAAK